MLTGRRKNTLLAVGAALLAAFFVLCGAALWLYKCVRGPLPVEDAVSLYITPQDDVESVRAHLLELGASKTGYSLLADKTDFKPSTGHYVVRPGDNLLSVMRRIKLHEQDPVRLVVPSVRLVSQLPAKIAPQLMMDSAQVAEVLADTAFISSLGYDARTLPAMVIPNTYEVYWDVKPQALAERLKRECDRFWEGKRDSKAAKMGLTRVQVATLASIVAEETASNSEKSMIAGLYYNRVRKGMKLEADPTVKFALRDFGLRRILFKHLEVESPYNTYRVSGLPPGPIRIPDIVDLDAVLGYREHDYLYMCAKEDFSGTHNFARTLSEHMANARKYSNALNKRGIK